MTIRGTFLGLALAAALAQPGLAGEACTAKAEGNTHGFYAAALLTGDAHWQETWAKAPHMTRPDFAPAPKLSPGDSAELLVFFAHPLKDKEGGVHINCELKVTRPGGKVAHMPPQRCFDDWLKGGPDDLSKTKLNAKIAVKPGDPKGIWQVEITLTDVMAQRVVPLKFCYEVTDGTGGNG